MVSGGERAPPFAGEPLASVDVDVIGIGEQQIPGGTELEPIPCLARGPEPAT